MKRTKQLLSAVTDPKGIQRTRKPNHKKTI